MLLKGKAHKYGSHINTDDIIPARYLNTSDAKELALHCMEDIDKEFKNKVKQGDIIVADDNFGCGSSREHAPIALKTFGISCVIAKTFARIFYRNSINIGLTILETDDASDISDSDELEIDTASGIIKNITKNKTYKSTIFPDFMQEIISSGGLMEYAKKEKMKNWLFT